MDLKPGYKTSEFWVAIFAKMLVAGLGAFSVTQAGLPPIASGAVAILAPILITWLGRAYGADRTALKAAAVVDTDAKAVAELNK